MKHLFRILICSLLFVVVGAAHGQVPSVMNYQGRLVQGDELCNGRKTVCFRLFDQPKAGTELYCETQSVMFVDGRYSAMIGAQAPATGLLVQALSVDPVYLEVQVDAVVWPSWAHPVA